MNTQTTQVPHSCGASASTLPQRAGISLKPEHFQAILDTLPDIGFFEVHAENYMVAGGPFHHYLALIREHYPLSIHGVGLSIGGDAPLDERHLSRLEHLLERYAPQAFSEHLAWSSHGPAFLNDLLPVPYQRQRLERVCDHIDQVQERLHRPMLLENPATYIEFATSEMTETEFISEVVRRTGCGLLLDVNNVYVSCTNHHWDPHAYLRALPLQQVGEIHLAGFTADSDADGARLLIDSHATAVADPVWQLYDFALDLLGPAPTLLERDADIPPLAQLLAEANLAEQRLRALNAEERPA